MRTVYFTLDENNRLTILSSTSTRNPNEICIDVPDGHDVLSNYEVYKYVNGELIKDIDYQQKLVDERQEAQNKPTDEEMNAIAIMELTSMLLGGE
ncbi:hypothetical protein [Virgibacillus oceani]|uniref:Uncharacterized protein n=1 Tax=Virgibacillus oceani TaxID=1479511 RepID=A0A917H1S4_9BACI|nr:hypothetical protein [Virgibacillus oceani]GGG64813.1 hypothetical protein GCM10011398_05550 [Virgibacillus oceani]